MQLSKALLLAISFLSIGLFLPARADDNLEIAKPPSIEELESKCNAGDFVACNNAGVHYVNGDKNGKYVHTAFLLFERACSGGNAKGCYYVSITYGKGLLGVVNNVEALKSLELSCNLGSPEGCELQGKAYDTGGDGLVVADRAKAIASYRVACNAGIKTACDRQTALLAASNARARQHNNEPIQPLEKEMPTRAQAHVNSQRDASPRALTNPKPLSVSLHSSSAFTEFQNKTVRCNFASTGAKQLSGLGYALPGMDNVTIETKYSYWFGENIKLIRERTNSGLLSQGKDQERERLELAYAKDFEAPVLAIERGEVSQSVGGRRLIELVQSWMSGC